MDPEKLPCRFDHNGECLICDAWPESCAHKRYLEKDYSYETKEELEKMFNELNQIEMTPDQAKDKLIEVLMGQVIDLSMMSKIELGDDVIAEIRRLKEIISKPCEENLC